MYNREKKNKRTKQENNDKTQNCNNSEKKYGHFIVFCTNNSNKKINQYKKITDIRCKNTGCKNCKFITKTFYLVYFCIRY